MLLGCRVVGIQGKGLLLGLFFITVGAGINFGILFGDFFLILGMTLGVMLTGDEELTYPVPWSTTPDTSALATQDQYIEALGQAGFDIINIRDRREFAAEFFAETRRRMEAAGGSPPLGVHIAMGESAPLKISNMVENIAAGRVSPVEIIASKLDH